jgi:hypothetical protein
MEGFKMKSTTRIVAMLLAFALALALTLPALASEDTSLSSSQPVDAEVGGTAFNKLLMKIPGLMVGGLVGFEMLVMVLFAPILIPIQWIMDLF